MKKDINLRENLALITCGDSFAILQRYPNEKGLQGITFSIPITSVIADLLEKSGIVQIQQLSNLGTLTFKRRDFYETTTMIDLIIDILERHETKNDH